MTKTFLQQIKTGKETKPRRVLFYGTHGVGKSTWASKAPEPIFLQTEDGIDDLGVSRFPLAGHFSEVMEMMRELMGQHKYKTLVVDSLDWLERLIWKAVCQEKQVDNIDDIGYAKGYGFAMAHWDKFKLGLDTIRKEKEMHIILIAHSKIERYNSPDVEAYDRYSPKLHKTASLFWQEWADEVFFANFKTNIVQSGEGFNKKTKGIGEGRRIVYTNERPAYLAKNRLGIKENLDMTWAAFEACFTNNKAKK